MVNDSKKEHENEKIYDKENTKNNVDKQKVSYALD